MEISGSQKRQGDKKGERSRNHKNTLMRALHKISGAIFAAGLPEKYKTIGRIRKARWNFSFATVRHQKGVKGDGQ